MTVIDANGMILGRLASIIAVRLLKGEKINIINCEKSIRSGKKSSIYKEYNDSIKRGSKEHGPYFPKRPERIMKRTIRSMLPYKKERGRNAMLNLKIYIGIPSSLNNEKKEIIDNAKKTRLSNKKFILLEDLSKTLGSKI